MQNGIDSREDKGKNKGKAEGRQEHEISISAFPISAPSSIPLPFLFPHSSLR
jgi:hypothetical protein